MDKLYEDGDYTECKRQLVDLLDQEPGFGRAHYLLGCIYYTKLDDYERALYHLKLAVKFAPKYPGGYITYAYLLNFLNRHEELLKHAEEALKIEGVCRYLIHYEIGRSYEKNRKYGLAMSAFEQAKYLATNSQETGAANIAIKRVRGKRLLRLKNLLLLKIK